MKRAPSALVSIGGFGIAVATLSVATTAAIVILVPQPPVQRISVGEAVAALRTPKPGFERHIGAEPQRARMVADVKRMQAMIDEVLTFAHEAATPAEVLDVRPLLAMIVEEMARDSVTVRLLPGDSTRTIVAEPAFRRAVENLVRNAIDYAGGGTITVRNDDATVCISVTDDGPGIPAADRERLLRPFERGDASHNCDTGGVGPGLGIVGDFVAQHRGDATLADAPGGGTIAILRLPSA